VTVPTQSAWTSLGSITLNVPADGFLWVTGTGRYAAVTMLNNYHHVNVVIGEGAPGAAPLEQLEINESFGPSNIRFFSHTQVLPVTAGTHTVQLWVRQTTGLTGNAPTNFVRATFQAMWVPNQY
jgi:hypothetical protein